jgi:hypothetical protein
MCLLLSVSQRPPSIRHGAVMQDRVIEPEPEKAEETEESEAEAWRRVESEVDRMRMDHLKQHVAWGTPEVAVSDVRSCKSYWWLCRMCAPANLIGGCVGCALLQILLLSLFLVGMLPRCTFVLALSRSSWKSTCSAAAEACLF